VITQSSPIEILKLLALKSFKLSLEKNEMKEDKLLVTGAARKSIIINRNGCHGNQQTYCFNNTN